MSIKRKTKAIHDIENIDLSILRDEPASWVPTFMVTNFLIIGNALDFSELKITIIIKKTYEINTQEMSDFIKRGRDILFRYKDDQ